MNRLISLSLLILCTLAALAIEPVEWGCESADTTAVNTMLAQLPADATPADAARLFMGHPYGGGLLEGDPEMLRVRLDSLDCTTLMDISAALALAKRERPAWTGWRDFADALRRLRYRRGNINGYASRLHYISDWAVDCSSRGLIEEITPSLPGAQFQVKSLDFMSTNADKYPALRDNPANFEAIRAMEAGFRSHRIPYVKHISRAVADALREGDIVAFTTSVKNLDVAHMGIIVMEEGTPHVLHASSSAGKVTLSSLPLADFLRRNRSFTGIRVFRLR